MRRFIIDESDLSKMSPLFQGRAGFLFGRFLLRILAIDRLNRLYSGLCHLSGIDFTSAWLHTIGVDYTVENEAVLDDFVESPFITVSNHPLGALDGLIMVDFVARRRPDYKFMVNSILLNVGTMSDHFVGVKPVTPRSGSTVENASGLKSTLLHLKDGHPMGFFPAGAVSNFNDNFILLSDREWQPTVMRLIQAAKVPVIPVYIHGKNSWFFNLLGRINWQLRSLRMPYEILNKRNKTIRVTVGNPIMPEEQMRYSKTEELACFLKRRTYELQKK